MSTSAISKNTTGAAAPKTSKSGLGNYDLDAGDFLKMMITQLQNQDPTNPTDSSALLTQISQIGQLQSSTSLQSTLKTLMLQDSLGSAGNLIGKGVEGLNDAGDPVSGTVSSVKVKNSNVYVELSSGDSLALSNVNTVTAASGASKTTLPAAAAAGGK